MGRERCVQLHRRPGGHRTLHGLSRPKTLGQEGPGRAAGREQSAEHVQRFRHRPVLEMGLLLKIGRKQARTREARATS